MRLPAEVVVAEISLTAAEEDIVVRVFVVLHTLRPVLALHIAQEAALEGDDDFSQAVVAPDDVAVVVLPGVRHCTLLDSIAAEALVDAG